MPANRWAFSGGEAHAPAVLPRFLGIESSPGPLGPDERLIFLHFPKCAGSTVHHCLAGLFAPAQICPARFPEIAAWPEQDLSPYRFISCHAPIQNLQWIPGPRKLITFLRDPVERAISFYEFSISYTDSFIATGQPHALHHARLAKSLGLQALHAEENLAQCHGVWNPYAQWLAGDPYLSPAGTPWRSPQEIVDAAIRNLDAMAFAGIAEDLETSFARLCDRLDIPNGYSGQRFNITRENHGADPQTFEPAQAPNIDAETLETIIHANSLDILIYRHAVQKFFGTDTVRRAIRNHTSGEPTCRVRHGRSADWVQNLAGGCLIWGPYLRLLPNRYKVAFQLRQLGPLPTDGILGFTDVISGSGGTVFDKSPILSGMFAAGAATLEIEFQVHETTENCEFRVHLQPDLPVEVCQTVFLTVPVR